MRKNMSKKYVEKYVTEAHGIHMQKNAEKFAEKYAGNVCKKKMCEK